MTKQELFKIRGDLLKKGYTWASLARELDVSPAMVRSVVIGKNTSARIQDAIYNILGYNPLPDKTGAA